MMTKQHYTMLANGIKQAMDEATGDEQLGIMAAVEKLIPVLALDNPRFSPILFRAKCGMYTLTFDKQYEFDYDPYAGSDMTGGK